MPRENIHWCVVDEVIELLDHAAQPRFLASIKKYRNFAYLGAIAHDAPYYYKRGHHPFEQVAEFLHGFDGNDTLEPIKKLLTNANKVSDSEQREKLIAFAVGMTSHVAVDVAFHPMVYYFTGNYNNTDCRERSAARAKHRLLEVYLDAWFTHEVGLDATLPSSVAALVKSCEPDLQMVCEQLSKSTQFAGSENFNSAENWKNGIAEMAFLQRLFISNFIGAAVRVVTALTGNKLKGIDSLFSFGRRTPEKLLNEALKYQNPLTGEWESKQVIQMFQDAVTDCLSLISNFESLFSTTNSEPPSNFMSAQGKSLNVGLYGGKVEDVRYFSKQGLDLTGLKIR